MPVSALQSGSTVKCWPIFRMAFHRKINSIDKSILYSDHHILLTFHNYSILLFPLRLIFPWSIRFPDWNGDKMKNTSPNMICHLGTEINHMGMNCVRYIYAGQNISLAPPLPPKKNPLLTSLGNLMKKKTSVELLKACHHTHALIVDILGCGIAFPSCAENDALHWVIIRG